MSCLRLLHSMFVGFWSLTSAPWGFWFSVSGSSFRWSMLDIMTSNSDLWTNLATELRLPLGSDMCSALFPSGISFTGSWFGPSGETCRSKGPGKSICPPVWWQSQQHAICEQVKPSRLLKKFWRNHFRSPAKQGRIFVCGFINAAYGFWAIVRC